MPCNTGDAGSLPCQGTKIPHARATKPTHCKYCMATQPTHHSGRARVPRRVRLRVPEPTRHNHRAHTPQLESLCAERQAPARHNEGSVCRIQHPMQQKKKKNPNSNKQSKQKIHNEIPPHIQRKKKRKITDADRDVEKTEHLCTVGGNANGAATVENSGDSSKS